MTDGTRSIPSSQDTTASAIDALPTRTSLTEVSTVSGSTPREKVRQAWASRSTRRTRSPRSANAAPRLATEVVFATPPFWLASATTQPDRATGALEELFLGVALAISAPLVTGLEGRPRGLLRPHPLPLRTGSTVVAPGAQRRRQGWERRRLHAHQAVGRVGGPRVACQGVGLVRSEERRVGKECRSRGWPYH